MNEQAGKDVIGLIPVPAQLLTRPEMRITASATMLSLKLKRIFLLLSLQRYFQCERSY